MKRSTLLVLLFPLAILLMQCAPLPAGTAGVPVAQTVVVQQTVVVEKQVTPSAACAKQVYVLTAPLVHPYIAQWQASAEATGAELGVEVIYLSPAQFDNQKQVDMTESALSLPCLAGLSVIAAVPDIFEASLKQAADMGVGTTQNASCGQAINASICMSTDFEKAGAVVAERLAKELNGKGNVVVGFGAPDDANHALRQKGLEDYFAKNAPDIKVIGVMKNCDDPAGTVKCAEDALAAYPTMNAYYSTGNLPGVGAAQVFPKAGRSDIIITGVDDAPEMIEAIKNNPKMFTYVQQPFGQGYLAVYIPWLMKNKGLKPTQKYLDTGITIVDQSNLTNYQDTMKQKFEDLKKLVDTEIMKPK